MIDKAIARITDEMMKLDNPFAEFIEEHLTDICTNERVAQRLLDPGKSLREFVNKTTEEMRSIAKKGGTGAQSAGLPDHEFYRRAEEYFGITTEDKEGRAQATNGGVIDISLFL